MKKFSKIKLNQFSKDELDQRKMNALRGGCDCRHGICGCYICDDSPYNASSDVDM
ncbi:MAG: TIGR04149 family rSAM-modified RiPP, partial [Tannerella sp.]|nr:TIGR04149 family rSAM-modified RiPP [Tannerella sp.]